MKTRLRNALPAPVLQAVRNGYDGLMRLPELPAAYFHPWRRSSIRRLAALKDRHLGQRAFILGNGPSLKHTDLSKLRGEVTFGLNRIYLMFPELGFPTSYLVSINDLVIEQCAAELLQVPVPRFFAWRSRRHFESFTMDEKDLPIFLYTSYTGPRFARDARGRLWEGATVTNVALQLAFHMGFSLVILIGIDHNFTSQGPANTTVVSQGDDPNHFSPSYFGAGFRWQLPDLETSERGYRLARLAYEKAGRRIVDATIGGKLEVFEKVNYLDLF